MPYQRLERWACPIIYYSFLSRIFSLLKARDSSLCYYLRLLEFRDFFLLQFCHTKVEVIPIILFRIVCKRIFFLLYFCHMNANVFSLSYYLGWFTFRFLFPIYFPLSKLKRPVCHYSRWSAFRVFIFLIVWPVKAKKFCLIIYDGLHSEFCSSDISLLPRLYTSVFPSMYEVLNSKIFSLTCLSYHN